MKHKISIIMPAYNVGDYIMESITSIQQQTYSDWELIVVDDGSTDDTAGIVKTWMSKDARISLIQQENGGVSIARNRGMAVAQGDYISFLDGDDLWEPPFLEKMMRKSIEGHAFIYARTKELFPDGRAELVGPEESVEGRLDRFRYRTNELRLTFHISALLIARSLVTSYDLHFEPGIAISEDTGFFIELLSVAEAACVPEILTTYRRRKQSATASWNPEKYVGQVTIYDRVEPFVKAHAPELLTTFYAMRDYVAYRFCLRCIRENQMEMAVSCLEEWNACLREFVRGDGRFSDRMKCRGLLAAMHKESLLAFIGRL